MEFGSNLSCNLINSMLICQHCYVETFNVFSIWLQHTQFSLPGIVNLRLLNMLFHVHGHLYTIRHESPLTFEKLFWPVVIMCTVGEQHNGEVSNWAGPLACVNINVILWDISLLFLPFLKQTQIARFMGPPWGPPGANRTQVGPMSGPLIMLSGNRWGVST